MNVNKYIVPYYAYIYIHTHVDVYTHMYTIIYITLQSGFAANMREHLAVSPSQAVIHVHVRFSWR